MTFTILGTAAAEGWPALWCPCEVCARARELGGKDIRRRAAYQFGDRIHVDFGPDAYWQMIEFGLQYQRLEHLLITHSHQDHLDPQEFSYRSTGFVVEPIDTITIHGNEAVRDRLLETVQDFEKIRARFELVVPFEPMDLGEGVTATALPADHAKGEEPVIHLFEREERALLQANDTGWFPDSTWRFLETWEGTLDVLVIECTYGPRDAGRNHLGAAQVIEVRDELRKIGALKPDARVIVTHFSHNGGWLHGQLEEHFGPQGIEVAYDGMQIEL